MRHRRKTVKLGRSQAHRDAMIANQAANLIEHERITTTLAKAKALRPFAEKLVTMGKKGTLHARRTALATLGNNSRYVETIVKKLFDDIAPRCANRAGGYCRILKLGQRSSDAAPMALIEWVDKKGGDGDALVTTAKPEPAKAAKAKTQPAPAAETPAVASPETAPAAAPETASAPVAEAAPAATPAEGEKPAAS